MKEPLPNLDDAMRFVDALVVHKARHYARRQLEAVPDLLQEAKLAVWLRWRKDPADFDAALCYHVGKQACYQASLRGASVDSHLFPDPRWRIHGEYEILSLERDLAQKDQAEWSTNERGPELDTRRDPLSTTKSPELRPVERAALKHVLLNQLDQALMDNPSVRRTLRMLRQGFTTDEIAHERNLSKPIVRSHYECILAVGRRLWGLCVQATGGQLSNASAG